MNVKYISFAVLAFAVSVAAANGSKQPATSEYYNPVSNYVADTASFSRLSGLSENEQLYSRAN